MRRPHGPSPLRVMLYCHDTFGLGHSRRTLTLAGYLRGRWPEMSQLIVTGSPLAQSFRLPEDADYIKLPSVDKIGAERYEPRSLRLVFRAVRAMRREILLSAAEYFEPDMLIVDNVPAGLKREAVPTLRYLKEVYPKTKLILGLRDIVDEASLVRRAWTRDGVYELLNNVYDLILVYGTREVYDVIGEYGFGAAAAAKTRYVGYLQREGNASPEQVRADLGLSTKPFVLVTAGGGADGYHVFRAVLDGLRHSPEAAQLDWLLVGGPLMAQGQSDRLLELAAATPGARFLRFVDDLAAYVGAADALVSMGGYNSICEILSHGRPAVIVPRIEPRREQLIRAIALSERGLVRMIHPSELTPDRLLAGVRGVLDGFGPRENTLPMDGLPAVAAELEELLQHGNEGASAGAAASGRQ